MVVDLAVKAFSGGNTDRTDDVPRVPLGPSPWARARMADGPSSAMSSWSGQPPEHDWVRRVRADFWQSAEPVLVQTTSWAGGAPHLVVASADGERHRVPVMGERMAFRVEPDARWCIGRFDATRPGDARHVPCDRAARATTGTQCDECARRDDSRFMHHIHRGGYVPDSVKEYLEQPHRLYIATFADGTSKVGTASNARGRTRLDEQGAVAATYLAQVADGAAVRVHEDAVTAATGIPQTKHKSGKAASLVRPLPRARVAAAHADAVEHARAFLAAEGVALTLEPWRPPPHHDAFFATAGAHVFDAYPHSLATGEHCLTAVGIVGGVALVTVNDDDAPLVVDLDALRGRRIEPAPVRSPETMSQQSLF